MRDGFVSEMSSYHGYETEVEFWSQRRSGLSALTSLLMVLMVVINCVRIKASDQQ